MAEQFTRYSFEHSKIIKEIKDIFIPTDNLQFILDEIQDIRELSRIDEYRNLPNCIFVAGESGVGKSQFLRLIEKKSYRYTLTDNLKEQTIVPVLYCEIPKALHPKPIVSELLEALGDPLKGLKGDVRQLTSRLVELLRECKTELIIIDELQHAIDKANNTVIQDIGEWFKILINKSKVPIAFFGTPWATGVFDANPQLSRRVSKRNFVIPHYTSETFDKFQMFLQKLEKSCQLNRLSHYMRKKLLLNFSLLQGATYRNL